MQKESAMSEKFNSMALKLIQDSGLGIEDGVRDETSLVGQTIQFELAGIEEFTIRVTTTVRGTQYAEGEQSAFLIIDLDPRKVQRSTGDSKYVESIDVLAREGWLTIDARIVNDKGAWVADKRLESFRIL